VVWDDVKFLKKNTAQGTTVHEKYTHVCVAFITVTKSGEEGEEKDGGKNKLERPPPWMRPRTLMECNVVFSIQSFIFQDIKHSFFFLTVM
jgi:hypothetical protein